MRKKRMKLGGTPAERLKPGFPWTTISLRKMPNAPLKPPTHGPNKTAKTAGMTTAGKKPTPKKLIGAVKIPTTA